jgi:hypothetical protein
METQGERPSAKQRMFQPGLPLVMIERSLGGDQRLRAAGLANLIIRSLRGVGIGGVSDISSRTIIRPLPLVRRRRFAACRIVLAGRELRQFDRLVGSLVGGVHRFSPLLPQDVHPNAPQGSTA